MKGYPQAMFKENLTHVPEIHAKKPVATLDAAGKFDAETMGKIKDDYGHLDTFLKTKSAEFFKKFFSFDEFCKIRYSSISMMSQNVEDLFKYDPEYAIIEKIKSSMWKWGYGDMSWNETVDVYDGIRNFTFPLDGFDLRLDFTSGYHERGYARESDTYIDGVFAFLVYYKGEHVMTLGFSVTQERRLLVQQIQLAQRKGNRFLFRMPANRVEFVLDCFAKAFPSHNLLIADGHDIGNVSLQSYKNCLVEVEEKIRAKNKQEDLELRALLEEKIAHLTADLPRLMALYANTGRYTRAQSVDVNRIRHYPLAA